MTTVAAGVEGRRASLAGARIAPAVRGVVSFVLVIAALWGAWEGYKWLWESAGWTWPFLVDDTTMPHIHDILGASGSR